LSWIDGVIEEGGGVVASSSFSAGQRVSAGSGQGLPELLRWPRNASRPWGSGILPRFVRPAAGKQTMPGSVRQQAALARIPPVRLRHAGKGWKWQAVPVRPRAGLGRTRAAETPSLAS